MNQPGINRVCQFGIDILGDMIAIGRIWDGICVGSLLKHLV